MDRYMQSLYDVIVDRTPEGLIGAILIALVLALVVAGLFALFRAKVSDPSVLLTCLVLVANVAAMSIAAGYVNFASGRRGGPSGPRSPREERFMPGGGPRGAGLANRVLIEADTNGDGKLSQDEALKAAERFMLEVGHGDAVDEETLRNGIRDRLGPPGFPPPFPPPSERPRLSRPRLEPPAAPSEDVTAR